MAMSVVGYTLDDIIEKLTEAKFLHMHVQWTYNTYVQIIWHAASKFALLLHDSLELVLKLNWMQSFLYSDILN
jgi:hypothetical protein